MRIEQQAADGQVRRASLNAGANPSAVTTIHHYFKRAPSSDVTLSIADAMGQEMQRFSAEASDNRWMPAAASMNRWYGICATPMPFGSRSTGGSRVQAIGARRPVVPPGQYRVRLTAHGPTTSGRLKSAGIPA